MENLICLEHVSKSYSQYPVLNDLSLTFGKGRIIGVLGPNGCGKTTLFKILTGLIHDYSGTVTIEGHHPDVFTKSIISYLPEKTYFSKETNIQTAISLFSDFYSDFQKEKALNMLSRFNLTLDMKLKSMSKGMQEKLQLILVMSRQAKIYLLDEPLSGVDPATRDTILDTILTNYNEDATVILSTHLIYDVERIFDDVILMGYGHIIAADSADNIRAQSGKSLDEYFREVFKC
jgi:ABC-type multidrug transport system, ATPase component